MSEINPIEFGELRATVSLLETQVAELRSDMKTLLELANKSKGGFWMGMVIASGIGGMIGWLTGGHLPIGK